MALMEKTNKQKPLYKFRMNRKPLFKLVLILGPVFMLIFISPPKVSKLFAGLTRTILNEKILMDKFKILFYCKDLLIKRTWRNSTKSTILVTIVL